MQQQLLLRDITLKQLYLLFYFFQVQILEFLYMALVWLIQEEYYPYQTQLIFLITLQGHLIITFYPFLNNHFLFLLQSSLLLDSHSALYKSLPLLKYNLMVASVKLSSQLNLSFLKYLMLLSLNYKQASLHLILFNILLI